MVSKAKPPQKDRIWHIAIKYIIKKLCPILIILTSLSITIKYFIISFKRGFLDSEAINLAIYILIGCYVYLKLDDETVEKLLGLKKIEKGKRK